MMEEWTVEEILEEGQYGLAGPEDVANAIEAINE
jgi:hypothetical protein